ncbi:MAG: AraC family transcriptional regulator [Filifactoraceae bacterium]
MYKGLRKEMGIVDIDLNNNKDTLIYIKEKIKEYFGIREVMICYDGNRIYDDSGLSQYCSTLQNDANNVRKCNISAKLAEVKTLLNLRPVIYSCYGGVINFSIPVVCKKEVIGVLICGTFAPKDNKTAVSIPQISEDLVPIVKTNKQLKLFKKEETIGNVELGLLINSVNNFVEKVMEGKVADEDVPFRLKGDNKINRSINKSLEYIYINIEHTIKLEEVAEISGFSTFYFCKIFKKTVGVGFSQYLRVAKMERAKELLKDDVTKIYEVSKRLGFNENNYFARVFREIVGMTPREYRKLINGR